MKITDNVYSGICAMVRGRLVIDLCVYSMSLGVLFDVPIRGSTDEIDFFIGS